MRDGKGTMKWKNGTKYEGEWRKNSREGQGTLTSILSAESLTYTGGWKSDKKDGYGELRHVDVDGVSIYNGYWKDGEQHGKGDAIYKDGRRYSGDWVNGERHGFGVVYYEDGSGYKGRWENGFWDYANGKRFTNEERLREYFGITNDSIKPRSENDDPELDLGYR